MVVFAFKEKGWSVTETSYVQQYKLENISINNHKKTTVVTTRSQREQFIVVWTYWSKLFNFSWAFYNDKLVEE